MNTAYKIYANILNEKMKKEVEKKLERQFGFRAERSMMEAIYTLNFVVNKEISKKKRKIYILYWSQVAFDKVDRVKLGEMLRKIGMRTAKEESNGDR